MEEYSIQALLNAPLHQFRPEDWSEWYPRVAELVHQEDAAVRDAAVERLAMGAFWAEHSSQGGPREFLAEAERRRTTWLIDVVDKASRLHADVLLSFLKVLRHQGDRSPFPEVLLPWLHELARRSPAGIPLERIEGAIVLLGGLDAWEEGHLPPVLDHSSDYVRACAAHMMGRAGQGESQKPDELLDSDFIAKLTAKELSRPGIAGPYWSGAGLSGVDFEGRDFDPVEWMLGIIEQRTGPEPADLPFNGLDFHIHELAADDPSAVRRLLSANRADLAVMTATEIRDEVPGMGLVLYELAEQPDSGLAVQAQIHLANYYRLRHPRADQNRIRHLTDWQADAEVFVIRYGQPGHHTDKMVIFPNRDAVFDDVEAWSLIDAALPPDRRGDLARHYLAPYAAPAPVRLGRDELSRYASGAEISLIGAKEGHGWRRIEISFARLFVGS
ncbi:hypothetical protein ACI3KW_01325 [Devosia sp. ZW T5_3]|uniref:hypothetical protein n=1 Tax=Devosia sp. ZW T5_3 TaxID=3378085 RepID=UPI003851C496